jgi:hypothetical protein
MTVPGWPLGTPGAVSSDTPVAPDMNPSDD